MNLDSEWGKKISFKFIRIFSIILFFIFPILFLFLGVNELTDKITLNIFGEYKINFVLYQKYFYFFSFLLIYFPLQFILLNFFHYFTLLFFNFIITIIYLIFSLFIFLKNIKLISLHSSQTLFFLSKWDYWSSIFISLIFIWLFFFIAYKAKEKFEKVLIDLNVKVDNIKLKTNELNYEALDLKKKFNGIKDLINKFNFLNKLSSSFSAELNKDTIIKLCEDTLLQIFKLDNYIITIFENKKLNIEKDIIIEFKSINKELILYIKNIFSQKISPIFIPDIDKEILYNELKDKISYKSFICIPLLSGNTLFGAIAIFNMEKNLFTLSHLRLLYYLGNIFTVAYCNSLLYDETERLAQKDGLTNLYKRWYFEEEFKKEINIASRYKKDISIIMLDIDHFKKVNDTYGHHIGDKVLSEIATKILKALKNPYEIAARYGGEEFIILLPAIDKNKAIELAEKIRISIENEIKLDQIKETITASFGVASFPTDTNDINNIITLADTALYKAKNSGRNKTCFL